jgi:hypothetical protein
MKIFVKNITNFWTILLNSLKIFNNYLLVSFIGKLSIFLLLIINQGILNIFSNKLLYLIVIISFIKLFYNLILSFFNVLILLKKEFKIIIKNYFILLLNILKIVGLTLILNKIYINYSEFLLFNELLLYVLIYSIISLIIINFRIIINKIKFKNFNKKIMNILILISFNRLIRPTNLSVINNENNNNDNNLLNTANNKDNKDNNNENYNNTNSEDILPKNTTNIQVNVHAEDMVKKGIESISDGVERSLIQVASQIGLAGSIGAGMSAGASISAGQRPKVRIASTLGFGLAGGSFHVAGSAINRVLIKNEENKIIDSNENPPSPVDSFINNPKEDLLENPVNALLLSILVMLYCLLLLLIILLFTYFSKIILSYNYQFNWLEKIFSKEKSIKLKSIILNFLNLFSGIRDFNIIMFIIALIFIIICTIYYYSVFYFNLEFMCKLYLEDLKK